MEGRWTIRLDHAGNELAPAQPEPSDRLVPVVPCGDAAVERGARAIHHHSPVAIRRSHESEMRLLEWDEEPEWAREVCRRMARAGLRAAGETP